MYLLDANVPIRAHGDYYPIDRIPQFWDWLLSKAKEGLVKFPLEIYGEINDSTGLLGDWLRKQDVSNHLILQEEVNQSLLNEVLDTGYGANLTETEIKTIGNDAMLIAYAYKEKTCRTIVTKEKSKSSKRRSNRHIPDVCKDLNIRVINDYQFYKELDFRITEQN